MKTKIKNLNPWLVFALLAMALSIFLNGIAKGEDKEPPKEIQQQCPVMKMTESCLLCHSVPTGKLKEARPDALLDYPNRATKIREIDGEMVGYYLLTNISDTEIKEAFDYLFTEHDMDRVIIEIQSPGGGLFAAHRIVGLMRYWQGRGKIIETQVNGFALSAGAYILANGSKGFRNASTHSSIMCHEIQSFSGINIESPSDKEGAASISPPQIRQSSRICRRHGLTSKIHAF